MPLGGRNPTDPPDQRYLPAPAGAGYGPQTPASAPGGSSAASIAQWFTRTLPAVMTPVELPGFGSGTFPTAILPAPGPGISYVIERMALGITAVCQLYVYTGDAARTANVVDGQINAPAGLLVMADGASGIRCGSQDRLFITWGGLTDPAGLTARVQVRVEPA